MKPVRADIDSVFFPSRYPHIACELLTSEVFAIVEQLSENEHLLELLWAFLDSPETLNPLVGRCVCGGAVSGGVWRSSE